MEAFRTLRQQHERLKTYIHTAFRYPLPPAGRTFMGFVYFTIPVIGGWYVMQWAISKSHDSIGIHGEKLPVKQIQGLGKKIFDDTGELKTVGAGGMLGGVNLADSDAETQERNRKKLLKFLKRQRNQYAADEKE